MREKNKYINRLYQALKGQNVPKGANPDIKPDKHFALERMNGAGKTTVIKSLLDFCQIDQADTRIFDTSHHQTQGLKQQAPLPERLAPPYALTSHEFLHCLAKPESVA